MTQVKADAYVRQVVEFEDQQQVRRCGGLAQQVLHQQAYTQWTGKRPEMFESRMSVLDGPLRPPIFLFAQVDDQVLEGNTLG